MRLSELHPDLEMTEHPSVAYLRFDCPHCVAAFFPEPVRIRLKIANGASPAPRVWGWNGETEIEKLTLTPSVDANHGNGAWHGLITAGEVTSA